MKKGGRWLIILAVTAVVVVLFLVGPNGLIKLVRMKTREAYLKDRIVDIQAEIEMTSQKIDKLSTDPDFLKQVAAEKLEMIDPNDLESNDPAPLDTVDTSADEDQTSTQRQEDADQEP